MRLFYFILILILSSCLSSKNADRQLAKINDRYPAKCADLCITKYPITFVKADTIYKDSIFVFYDTIPAPCDTIFADTTRPILSTSTSSSNTRETTSPRKYKKVRVKIPQVIKYYEDSAKIFICLDQQRALQQKVTKLNKSNDTLKWVIALLALLLLLMTYQAIRKYENSSSKKAPNN